METTIRPTMIIGIAIGMQILVKICKVLAPKERQRNLQIWSA